MALTKQTEDVKQYILDQLDDNIGLDQDGSELHHETLNTNYFMIYTNEAKQWLKDSYSEAVEVIQEWETSNFGQVSTDFSDAATVANMFAYVIGEDILSCTPVNINTDRKLNENTLQIIKLFVRNYK